MTDFYFVSVNSSEWATLANTIRTISWTAGESLYQKMNTSAFTEWEGLTVGKIHGELVGFCTVVKQDSLQIKQYTPFIGYVFVFEDYRGQRLSQKLLTFSENYLKKIGFGQVYLVSDEKGLYEKFGYEKIGLEKTMHGNQETIFQKKLK